ncbi:hypothetical protein [Leptospira kanakyensis]|uniref:Uncharacterized protein n=1 Tax=Leptospira kanakyensis TaxID=2484968 RepID=A0A6N4QCZ0_9LEPT|nr:hypothetical protein [Leptospira kanakyensis]MCW7468687.1 hypothetical protein [Leptospira kanakyensis]MCW7479680.1 hypothetical protein [Leptospira kanakyensis]TGK49919.1 hypothetical protein EHQ11_09300 [Leptospira kanakyensis]TGK58564.1 hypothetical protein EHQ16_13320 [Leptospira kanakyensis]TGK69057.1 hypothetical protein EHQ18_09460 [Leptospira kanakyensis]
MKIRILFFLFASGLLINCGPSVDRVETDDAQSQVYAAAKFASEKCGNPIPNPPLVILNKPIQRNLDFCTIAITRTECPFLGYPLPCTLIYLEQETGDLPWYLNFNELSKIQIK